MGARNVIFSAKDVETFPARPRRPPQGYNGGTSPTAATTLRKTMNLRRGDTDSRTPSLLDTKSFPRQRLGLIGSGSRLGDVPPSRACRGYRGRAGNVSTRYRTLDLGLPIFLTPILHAMNPRPSLHPALRVSDSRPHDSIGFATPWKKRKRPGTDGDGLDEFETGRPKFIQPIATSGAAAQTGSPRLNLRRPGRNGNAVEHMATPWMNSKRAVPNSSSPLRLPAPRRKQDRPASTRDALDETETPWNTWRRPG